MVNQDKILTEKLQFLHDDMKEIAILLRRRGNEDKSKEMENASKVMTNWIEGIKEEAADAIKARCNA